MKHTINALVENEFGVLARISSLFSGRGYNIQSLTVAETLDPKVSSMTLVTSGSDDVIEQITKQLGKLVNVLKVVDVTKENPINRILALVKVETSRKTRDQAAKVIENLDGKILDEDTRCCIAEFRADPPKLKQILDKLKPFGILEFEQTGNIAMQRGKKVGA